MTFRRILPSEPASSRIQTAIKNFHPVIVEQVESAIAKNAVVVIGMRGNYFVKKR